MNGIASHMLEEMGTGCRENLVSRNAKASLKYSPWKTLEEVEKEPLKSEQAKSVILAA